MRYIAAVVFSVITLTIEAYVPQLCNVKKNKVSVLVAGSLSPLDNDENKSADEDFASSMSKPCE